MAKIDGKIRVLRVIARMNIGGPAIHVTLLNAGLDPDRFESLLVSGTENPGEGNLLDWAASKGVRPIMIPEIIGEATFKPRDVIALRKMTALMRREKPHIVHTHTAKAGFVGRIAAWLAEVPIVVHTYHGHVLHGYYSPLKSRLLGEMETTLARITDRIVAVSDKIRDELAAYGVAPKEKIVTVPLGLELDEFLDNACWRGAFRRELGLADDAPLVGIVGRLAPIKNHRLFLEMAAQMLARVPAARFVVVGDGLLRAELEEYACVLGIAPQVTFAGWRRDLAKIYADLDALVVSSLNEGTPVSAIEAMASGCPVVATRVGGLPDLIAEGETGYLVESGDASGLTRAVADLLGDRPKSEKMAQTARQFVRERFSARRLITDIENLYEQLLAQKGL